MIYVPSRRKAFQAGGGGDAPGTTGLIAYWKMDETTGDRADSHGSFTLSGSAGYVSGVQGNAADCSGSLSLAEKSPGHSAGALFGTSGPFTMCGWIYGSPSLTTGFQTIFYAFNGGNVILVRFFGSDMSCLIWDTTWREVGNQGYDFKGSWNFVAFGVDAADKPFFRVNTDARNTGAARTGDAARALNTYLNQLGAGNPCAYLDEWSVWQRALTDGELDWLYNSGAGRTYADL